MTRKQFLRTCGTVLAGGALAGVATVLIDRNRRQSGSQGMQWLPEEQFVSPYKPVTTFQLPQDIHALAQQGEHLYVASGDELIGYDWKGREQWRMKAEGVIRDLAIRNNELYLLHPSAVSVCILTGSVLRRWDACSPLSDYCAMAVTDTHLYVTDRNNKNICQYGIDGQFRRFIESPNRFIIPSLTFGIEVIGDKLYCANSGRHQIECYTPDGEYLSAFGEAGGAPGMFAGCCNPVYLTATSQGDILTSEKGVPRISCYGADGTFRSILLDAASLGGGTTAYIVKVKDDQLVVAGKHQVTIYRYDSQLASQARACAGCHIACPLRIT